jgi:hypothetical protein
MAGFHTKTFQIHDDYMTPSSAWEAIVDFIPKDKIIWEAFYGNGESGKDLQKLLPGNKVIHKKIDFYDHDLGDILISNPAFSDCPNVLKRLVDLNKPFIMIMPSSKINTQYFRKLFAKNPDKIQIIIPRKRIQFIKLVDGVVPENYKSICNFDCFYYCWKMELPHDIIWLE